MIPDEADALRIHRKYGSVPVIVEHCRAVERVARIIASELTRGGVAVDERVIQAGALLHDVGRTRVQTVRHGYEGAEILRKEGVDERVVEVVKRHVGAGITREEARRLGLPEGDYVPRTLEQKVVCFADKMIDSNRARPFAEEVKRFVRKGHDVKKLEALKEDLKLELGRDPEEVIFEKIRT
ncbi:MAG TPA: HDIG domain-containing protein [Nitrososphaerales archaeon]|nr:HDIG domain-containing protein [Nitrososphaerales archaeon]